MIEDACTIDEVEANQVFIPVFNSAKEEPIQISVCVKANHGHFLDNPHITINYLIIKTSGG